MDKLIIIQLLLLSQWINQLLFKHEKQRFSERFKDALLNIFDNFQKCPDCCISFSLPPPSFPANPKTIYVSYYLKFINTSSFMNKTFLEYNSFRIN